MGPRHLSNIHHYPSHEDETGEVVCRVSQLIVLDLVVEGEKVTARVRDLRGLGSAEATRRDIG